jgi:hypothetical protein
MLMLDRRTPLRSGSVSGMWIVPKSAHFWEVLLLGLMGWRSRQMAHRALN